MKNEISNLSHSVRDRLISKSKVYTRSYNSILLEYVNERFLYRLSNSEHRREFVLKGGLAFSSLGIPFRRNTKDIDFRGYVDNDLRVIKDIISDICVQEVEPDGITFDPTSINAMSIMEEADYPGIRVRLNAYLGKRAVVPIQIDINFTDNIFPSPQIIDYPTLINMPVPTLSTYTKESIVAEKLHIIVMKGIANSRLKDYYDLWLLSSYLGFEGYSLVSAISHTFENRHTSIPIVVPEGLNDEYGRSKQRFWANFVNTFDSTDQAISDFITVLSKIREFIITPMISAAEGESLILNWYPNDGWYRQNEFK